MRKNFVAVATPEKNKGNGVFVAPEDTFSTGIIRYVSKDADQDLKVGMKVSFGNKLQNIRMGAEQLKVMEDNNIVAIIGDSSEKNEANP